MGYAMVAGGKPDMAAPISGILASELAVGSVVKLMEDGVATEYLVVNQGKPSGSSLYDDSCDGTWLLRKDTYGIMQWNSSDVNIYANGIIHPYLNGDFFNLFGSVEQSTIKQVKIPYINGTGKSGLLASGSNGLLVKVFLLGAYEVGYTSSDSSVTPEDGAKLSYFISGTTTEALNKRIAYRDNNTRGWWVRTPRKSTELSAFFVMESGDLSIYACTQLGFELRPALILPSIALFDTNTLILKGVA